jgi:TatD DNase family protein
MKTMTITDTHTHLYSRIDQDRDEMMQGAIQEGVTRFYSCNRLSCTEAMYDLEKNYPDNVFFDDGLHPTM